MTFDIYLLDKLEYDDAEPLIENYVNDTIRQFIKSRAGQAHIQKYPQGGFWIGNFIDMAYTYGGFTLPKMTKSNVQVVMEHILPRKLTLTNPSDFDGAIAELTAFWTFLDEDYRFRSAKTIIKYLKSIETKFSGWMSDPGRGGIAKQFIMQGAAAGFDMHTQEGIEAFQQKYNQNLANNPNPIQPPEPFSMTSAPSDMVEVFELLGLELPEVGAEVNPLQLMEQFFAAMEQLEPATAERVMAILEANVPPEVEDLGPPLGADDLRLSLLKQNSEPPTALTEEEQALLRSQTITPTTPGSIVQDFQQILQCLGEKA